MRTRGGAAAVVAGAPSPAPAGYPRILSCRSWPPHAPSRWFRCEAVRRGFLFSCTKPRQLRSWCPYRRWFFSRREATGTSSPNSSAPPNLRGAIEWAQARVGRQASARGAHRSTRCPQGTSSRHPSAHPAAQAQGRQGTGPANTGAHVHSTVFQAANSFGFRPSLARTRSRSCPTVSSSLASRMIQGSENGVALCCGGARGRDAEAGSGGRLRAGRVPAQEQARKRVGERAAPVPAAHPSHPTSPLSLGVAHVVAGLPLLQRHLQAVHVLHPWLVHVLLSLGHHLHLGRRAQSRVRAAAQVGTVAGWRTGARRSAPPPAAYPPPGTAQRTRRCQALSPIVCTSARGSNICEAGAGRGGCKAEKRVLLPSHGLACCGTSPAAHTHRHTHQLCRHRWHPLPASSPARPSIDRPPAGAAGGPPPLPPAAGAAAPPAAPPRAPVGGGEVEGCAASVAGGAGWRKPSAVCRPRVQHRHHCHLAPSEFCSHALPWACRSRHSNRPVSTARDTLQQRGAAPHAPPF